MNRIIINMSVAQFNIVIGLMKRELVRLAQELQEAETKLDHHSLAIKIGRLKDLYDGLIENPAKNAILTRVKNKRLLSSTRDLKLYRGQVWIGTAEKVKEGLIVLPNQICPMNDVAKMLGIKRTTFIMWFEAGILPKSILIKHHGSWVRARRVGEELIKKLKEVSS